MIFVKETHQYIHNGIIFRSVTQLLSKHKLATDYSQVDPNILKNASNYGSKGHEQIEKYLKGLTFDVSDEIVSLIALLQELNIQVISSENIVYDEILEIAGTIDLIGLYNNKVTLFDFKFTSVFYKKSVRWQLSLYAYLIEKMSNGTIKIDEIGAFWLNRKTKQFVLKELEMIPREEILKLLECEARGLIYG